MSGFDIIVVMSIAAGQCPPGGCPIAYAPIVRAAADPYWKPIPNEAGQVALMADEYHQLGVYVFSTGTYHKIINGKYVAQDVVPIAPPSPPATAPLGVSSDEQLLDRLRGHIDAQVESRLQAKLERHVAEVAHEIDNYDPANPKKGFALGAILAVAIGGLVTRIVGLIITAILVALFWKLLGKYVLWIVGAAVVGLLGVVVVSRSSGASAARRAVGK